MQLAVDKTRNYDEISPSAMSLLLLKGITNIPFAKEVASLVTLPDQYQPDLHNKDTAFWKRVIHFENRYWSIDQLVSPLSITNILELSSGFSLRGLATVAEKTVHYIDTDLPDLINQKQELMNTLDNTTLSKGTLKLLALNALDEQRFNEIIELFPEGPVVIINEGLLMYLGTPEKESLCHIIGNILKRRGGYWITGDIYTKTTLEGFSNADDPLKQLVEQQRIEENMFESFPAAESFFEKHGFEVDAEATPDLPKLSSLKYLLANVTAEQLKEMQSLPKMHTSWRLKVKSVADL